MPEEFSVSYTAASPWSTLFSIAAEQTKRAFFEHYEDSQEEAQHDWDLVTNCQDENLEAAAKAAADAATVAGLRVYDVYEAELARAAESDDPSAGLDAALKVLADAAFLAASESLLANTGDPEFEVSVAMALKATDEAFLHRFGDEDGEVKLALAKDGVSPHAENWYEAYDVAFRHLNEELPSTLTCLSMDATRRAMDILPTDDEDWTSLN